SGPINLPRRGARERTDFSCAAARVPVAPCCALAGRKGASGSRCRPRARGARRMKRAAFRLGTDKRLARKSDFERLLREGARRSKSGYMFYVAVRAEGPPRLGI